MISSSLAPSVTKPMRVNTRRTCTSGGVLVGDRNLELTHQDVGRHAGDLDARTVEAEEAEDDRGAAGSTAPQPRRVSLVALGDVLQTTVDDLGHLRWVAVKRFWLDHGERDLLSRQGCQIVERDRTDPLAQEVRDAPHTDRRVLPIAEAGEDEGMGMAREIVEQRVGLRQVGELDRLRRLIEESPAPLRQNGGGTVDRPGAIWATGTSPPSPARSWRRTPARAGRGRRCGAPSR